MSGRTDALRGVVCAAAAQGRVVITGHDCADTDSAISCVLVRALLKAWGVPAVVVLPEDTDAQSRRVLAWFDIDLAAMTGETERDDQLILVDHHQTRHPGRVIACIDHHPTQRPPQYPYVQIEPRGACALQALELMKESGMDISPRLEELAVTALWLDTIALRSTKVSETEHTWGRARAAALGLDVPSLEREGLQLKDMTLPAAQLAVMQKKAHVFGGVRVMSSALQTDAMTEEKLAEILGVLRGEILRERAGLWVLLVHDPIAMRSVQHNLRADGTVKTIAYDHLVSRGKDVMPQVEREMIRGEQETRKEGAGDGGALSGTGVGA